MNRFLCTLAVLSSPVLAPTALNASAGSAGQEPPAKRGSPIESELSQATLAKLERLPGAMLAAERDRFLAERGWHVGDAGGPGGAWLVWGEAPVGVDADHPAWGKARLIAYEQAWIEAKTRYVRSQRLEAANETLRRYVADDSIRDPRSPAASDAEASIRAKIALLTEAKLDRALRDEGVEPPRTLSEKRTLYERHLSRVSTVRAMGRLNGLRPVTTFEASDEDGATTVGVLAAASPELRALAESLASGNGWARRPRAAAASSLSEQVRRRGEDLIHDFGVRVLIDEHGDRALVAFGQSAPSIDPGAPAREMERKREAALMQAEEAATAALAQFLEETLTFSSESEVGETLEEYRATLERGFEEEGSLASFVDRLSQETRSRARADVRGIVRLHEWTSAHPATGQLLVGVVLAWSPSSEDAARAAARLSRSRPASRPDEGHRPRPGVRGGKDWDETLAAAAPSSAEGSCPEGVRRTGRASTRTGAITAALIEAIRSTHGVWIEMEQASVRRYEELLADLELMVRAEERSEQSLRQRTQGFVERYEVLAERRLEEEHAWEVELCAILSVFDPNDPRPGEARKTIAVLPLRSARDRYAIEGGTLAAAEAVRRLESALTARLTAAGRFRVLDRSYSRELDAEIEALTRGGFPPFELSKIGQKLGADFLLVGTLEDLALSVERATSTLTGRDVVTRGAVVSVDWRLIQVATREIETAGELRLALDDVQVKALLHGRPGALIHEPVLDRAADVIVEGVLDRLVPIQVSAFEGGSVYLNQSAPRLAIGMLLVVYVQGSELRDPATGVLLGRTEREVARIRVVRTEPAFAVAELESGSGYAIVPGAICRPLRPR